MKVKVYLPIRKDLYSGKEFFDFYCMSALLKECQRRVEETKNQIPMWDKDNPVLRYSQCEIKELEEI